MALVPELHHLTACKTGWLDNQLGLALHRTAHDDSERPDSISYTHTCTRNTQLYAHTLITRSDSLNMSVSSQRMASRQCNSHNRHTSVEPGQQQLVHGCHCHQAEGGQRCAGFDFVWLQSKSKTNKNMLCRRRATLSQQRLRSTAP